nr:lytic transglycosylase [uncultured bacterium]
MSLYSVRKDTAAADTLLRLFKMGVINARLGNAVIAAALLNTVVHNSAVLQPLAAEQIGDIAADLGQNDNAVAAYSTALSAAALPAKYRQHLFAKIKALADKGTAMPADPAWLDEYRKWEMRLRLFDAVGLQAVCDSLIKAGLIAEADTILEQHLPELNKREACKIVKRIFEERSSDSTTMTTKFLFTLASQARECGDFVTAERMLNMAVKRADFARTIPERKSLTLSAQIAFGREQWQKAIDIYRKYEAAYGADSDLLMNTARAYRNLGNADQAQIWYERHVKQFPSHAKTQEILWLRAWNLEEKGNFKAASAAYARLFGTKGKRTEEAYFRHALCYYKRQAFDSSAVHFAAFQRKYPQSSYLWAAMFWQGKNLAARGKTEEAYKVWNSLARLEPTDYYAHRARQLMGATGDSAAVVPMSAFAAVIPEANVRAWLDSISPPPKKPLNAADSLAIRRGAAMLAVARPEIADFFLDEYERNYPNNLLLQYDLATAYGFAGNPAHAFRVARRLNWRIPMEHRNGTPLQILAIMYPPFYSNMIAEHAERFSVDPLFVSSVMRQESIFDKDIVSPAGAIGLMQVMPATGKGIAGELREHFAEDSLYNPDYNIRFGTFYLRKRLNQFNGDKVLTLCSYNAGAHNAAKWQDRGKKSEPDVFVEDIGFLETRGYVKKVMGNYWTYKGLVNLPGYKYDLPKPREEYPWAKEW